MKRLLLILTVAALLVGCGSKGGGTDANAVEQSSEAKAVCKCTIVGRLDNYNAVGEVYLTDNWSARKVIATAKLKNNTFVISDLECEPTFARLMLESGRPVADLFVEDGKIVVSGDFNKNSIKASGTPANDAFAEMMKRSSVLLERALGANYDEAKALKAELDTMLEEYLAKNKDNLFGLYMLQQLSSSMPAKEVLEVLSSLPARLQTVAVAKRMKSLAERRFKTEPRTEGSDYVPHYIDIVQPNPAGETVSLKSVVEGGKNRYVLLDFWASWWRPSLGEMPVLKEAYSLYCDKGFEIYGVSLDRHKEFWKEAIDEQGIEWITVSSFEEFNSSAVEDYAVEPTLLPNFLIDCSNGVIIAKNLRGKALLAKLAELYK